MLKTVRPVPAPLPTDLPPPPDLSRLPSHIVHSGTVETLIGANDDLMARLKVNIRRNSVLEQQIMEHERVNQELSLANSSMSSQLQVLQEKDGIWKEKTQRSDQTCATLHAANEILEAKNGSLQAKIRELAPSVGYVRRIRKWVTPLVDQLKLQLASERKAVFAKEAVISDLRSRLAETIELAQGAATQYARDQARLVETHERNQKTVIGEFERLRHESKLQFDKAARMESAVAALASAENRIILLERQNQEFRAQAEASRNEARTIAGEAKTLMLEVDELRGVRDELQKNAARMQDQIESLQNVWSETEKRVEQAKAQHETLNRLNQELSRQLNEARKPELEGNC